MNPQAIMTPGGIVDQFTRGLSGVAQAFAQRSAIDRQAQQDAFSQARALENDRMAREAFARQQTWREQDIANQNREFGLRQQGDVRQQAIFDAKMAEANPEQFVNHPSLGGIARRALEDRANAETLRQFNLGRSGMPILDTPDAPVGSYVPESKRDQAAGYDTYNASQALLRDKINRPKLIWGADPITGEPVRVPDAPGVDKPVPPTHKPSAAAQLALKIKIDNALAKEEKRLMFEAEDLFPDHDYGWFKEDSDIAAQNEIDMKRKQYVENALAKKRAEYMASMTLDGSANPGTVAPSASSAVGASDPLADAWDATK